MVVGVSLVALTICLLPTWNSLLRTAPASPRCACNLPGQLGDEGGGTRRRVGKKDFGWIRGGYMWMLHINLLWMRILKNDEESGGWRSRTIDESIARPKAIQTRFRILVLFLVAESYGTDLDMSKQSRWVVMQP
jgi:hypothetical protein